jgi:hypothetical protein
LGGGFGNTRDRGRLQAYVKEPEHMWYPYRYLIAGRSQWEVMWFDLDIIPDPRAWLEDNLVPKAGPLVRFEQVTRPYRRSADINAFRCRVGGTVMPVPFID